MTEAKDVGLESVYGGENKLARSARRKAAKKSAAGAFDSLNKITSKHKTMRVTPEEPAEEAKNPAPSEPASK